MVRDTRWVQTAVIRDEHSDVPIILPTEAIELDVFRRAYQQDTFWCGLLLGGCRSQLATKLYVDCRRPSIDESSADHLYVKSTMSRSLLEFGRSARFAFPPPIGSIWRTACPCASTWTALCSRTGRVSTPSSSAPG